MGDFEQYIQSQEKVRDPTLNDQENRMSYMPYLGNPFKKYPDRKSADRFDDGMNEVLIEELAREGF